VAAYIAEIQAESMKAAECTLTDHLRDLQNLRDKALDAGEYQAAVKAEEQRGKAAGHYVTKIEGDFRHRYASMTDEELDAEIERNSKLAGAPLPSLQ
jgi:hypothetical protein